MLNKEKYAKEIVEIATKGHNIAMNKGTKTLCYCSDLNCDNCYFSKYNYPHMHNLENDCRKNVEHWANSEYIEPKEFTEQERAVLRALDKVEWVARDEDGTVYGYIKKPIKSGNDWSCGIKFINLNTFTSCEFKAIKWEDTEPTSRAEILGGGEQ